jgi:CRISPR/Cas system-associated exonuclease Cas4 (RecB family)
MLLNFYKTYDQKQKIKLLPTKDLPKSIEDYKKLIKPISPDFDISGKFDLVLELDDGNLAVVDFKTSKREESDDFQLQFYKLLAELNFKTLVSKAGFYYLRTGNIKKFDLSKKDTEKIKADILDKIKKIKKEKKFETRPSKLCKYCLFRTFCPAKKEVAEFTQDSLLEDFTEDLPF